MYHFLEVTGRHSGPMSKMIGLDKIFEYCINKHESYCMGYCIDWINIFDSKFNFNNFRLWPDMNFRLPVYQNSNLVSLYAPQIDWIDPENKNSILITFGL